MKKIGKLSFEQFKKFAFTDMGFSEVACESYPVIHFGVDDFNSNKNNRLEKAMLKKVCQQKE